MFRLAIEKTLNHMVNVNNIDIAHVDNKIVSFRVEDIDLSLFFLGMACEKLKKGRSKKKRSVFICLWSRLQSK